MTEGFLSRWSRRKAGKEKENAVDQQLGLEKTASQAADISSVAPKDPNTQTPLPLTLEDVEKIDRFAPDFSAFMKPDVDPVVQQAAIKKMFTDPHFNVMDGLDIYIDDYSKPDPLSPGMLERMVQSDMLKLFQKTGEGDHETRNQVASSVENTEPTASASEVSAQIDLTSNQPLAQEKLVNPDALPADLEKKKT